MVDMLNKSPGSRGIYILVAVFVIIGLVALLSIAFLVPEPSHDHAEQLTIGMPFAEQDALVWVAEDKGFFTANGLNVTVRDDYPTGVGPVGDMASGRNELAYSAEYPVLAGILSGSNISIIATIDRFQNEFLVIRRDTGVRNISDLRGRKIGVPKGTILEFYLGRLLAGNGVSPTDVTVVDVNITHADDAIANGEVDAVMSFQPHTARILDSGLDVIVLPAQGGQLVYGVVSARADWIAAHPETTRKFLNAIDTAERYADSNPGEIRNAARGHMNVTGTYIDTVLPDHQFGLSLDRSLITAMNDESRWMIENNLTQQTTIPEYREHIDTTALLEVKPGAVNIR